MNVVSQYLDKVKKVKKITSDYRLAKFLGYTSQSSVIGIRKRGSCDIERCYRIAEALDMNPTNVITEIRADCGIPFFMERVSKKEKPSFALRRRWDNDQIHSS